MALARLLLGTGATQYVLSTLAASSTYGGAARADVALRFPRRFGRRDAGSKTMLEVLVQIDATDEATLKSRYEELRAVVVNTTRDFDLQYDTGSTWLDMKTSTREYVAVSGEMETLVLSTTKALISLAFIGERAVQAAGSGGSGTIENPVGLQNAPQYDAQFGSNGNLETLIASATFVGSTSVEAQERAGTWRGLWQSSLPGWLSSATSLRDKGARFRFDGTKNECTVEIELEKDKAGAPAVDDTVTVYRYSAVLAPHTLGHRSGDKAGPPGGGGLILTVSGELHLRSDDESDFGGIGTAPTSGASALTAQVLVLIEHAKEKAKATGAKTIRPLEIEMKNSGWSCSFNWSAVVDTDVLAWTETVTRSSPSAATIIRDSDGADVVYRPAGAPMTTVRVRWAATVLLGGTIPEAFVPAGLNGGEVELVDETIDDPVYGTVTGEGDDQYAKAQTEMVQGQRDYRLLAVA